MANVNMLEAKTNLSKLVEEALHGGEVVICRDGKPAVKLVPVEPRRPRVRHHLSRISQAYGVTSRFRARNRLHPVRPR